MNVGSDEGQDLFDILRSAIRTRESCGMIQLVTNLIEVYPNERRSVVPRDDS